LGGATGRADLQGSGRQGGYLFQLCPVIEMPLATLDPATSCNRSEPANKNFSEHGKMEIDRPGFKKEPHPA